MFEKRSSYANLIRTCEQQGENSFSDSAIKMHLDDFREKKEFHPGLIEEIELSVRQMWHLTIMLSDEISDEKKPTIELKKTKEERTKHRRDCIDRSEEILGQSCDEEEEGIINNYLSRISRGRYWTEKALQLLRFLDRKEKVAHKMN